MQYYFLIGALPPLTIGEEPSITWEEFLFLCRNNLTARDFQTLQAMRSWADIQNMRAFWLGEPLDFSGNYGERALDEALLTGEGFPSYVYAFLEKYEQKEERVRHFPELVSSFFYDQALSTNDFVRDYWQFERDLRLVLLGFRAKRLQRDVVKELQYENPEDEIVQQLLAQKEAPSFEPPSRYESLKTLFNEYENAPLLLHRALLEFRFKWIEERLQGVTYSIECVLGYMLQLVMAWKWIQLDQKSGLQIIETIS